MEFVLCWLKEDVVNKLLRQEFNCLNLIFNLSFEVYAGTDTCGQEIMTSK